MLEDKYDNEEVNLDEIVGEVVDLGLEKREVVGGIMRGVGLAAHRVWDMFESSHSWIKVRNQSAYMLKRYIRMVIIVAERIGLAKYRPNLSKLKLHTSEPTCRRPSYQIYVPSRRS